MYKVTYFHNGDTTDFYAKSIKIGNGYIRMKQLAIVGEDNNINFCEECNVIIGCLKIVCIELKGEDKENFESAYNAWLKKASSLA